jgi:hypothetical protein
MLDVLLNVARSADVLHQVHAVWLQRSMNTLEDVEWPRLIVDPIKGVMKSKDSGSAVWSKSLRSAAMNSTLSRPALDASLRAYVIASCERSIPTNRLLG